MRRLIAIVLMLLLPIQAAWALVAMPCRGQVDSHSAHAAHAAHDAGGREHALHARMTAMADGAGHDAHHGHDGHHAAMQATAHHDIDPGDGTAAPDDAGPCSGSAACMSLHSPPLAADFHAGLPALQLPHALRPAEGPAFSSVPPAREQRPPIGLPA